MLKLAKKYFAQVHFLARLPATTDTLVLYISTLVSSAVGFTASVIVARTLGPTQFAIIAGYNAIVLTLAGFTDFGLGTGLIKFTAPYLKSGGDRKKANPYFRFVFYTEIVIGALLLALGLIFSTLVAKLIGQSLSANVVRIAVISAAITSTAAYVGAALAAHKKFKLNAAIGISTSLMKIAFVVVIWKMHALTVTNILIGYVALSFITAGIGFAFTPRDYLEPVTRAKLRRAGVLIFRFSGWLTLSFFITSVMGKLDFFYLYRLRGATDAGVYAAAQQLSQVYSILVGAITTVLTPYISEKTTHSEKVRFLKKTIPLALVGAVLFLLSTIFVPFIIELIFGAKFIHAIGPLKILIAALAVNVILIPITLMFVPLGKVKYGTLITALELVTAILLFPAAIKQFGANGAALTILATSLVGLILFPLILIRLMHKDKYRARPA